MYKYCFSALYVIIVICAGCNCKSITSNDNMQNGKWLSKEEFAIIYGFNIDKKAYIEESSEDKITVVIKGLFSNMSHYCKIIEDSGWKMSGPGNIYKYGSEYTFSKEGNILLVRRRIHARAFESLQCTLFYKKSKDK